METVRLRLAFDHILNKSLKAKGLDRCWILLKPQHQTISDLSSYILHAFNLQHDCPTGIILSMDEFAFPPFESTSILKDKDIIRVEKVGGVSPDILMIGNETNYLEAAEIVETQHKRLLANEEFEKESEDYQSEEEEEDAEEQGEDTRHVESTPEVKSVSKKRKASKELKSSKRKKRKPASSEDCANVVNIANNANGEQNGTLRSSKVKAKRISKTQEDSNGNVDASHSPPKFPSRSARRKKAKRIFWREQRRKEKQLHRKSDQQSSEENQLSNQIVCQESAEKGNQEFVKELIEKDAAVVHEDRNLPDEDSDVEEDVVPMVIRPGHIRFVSLGEEGDEQTEQQNQFPLDNFQWNGVTSKKKGQKWGREKITSYKRNNYKDVNQNQEQAKVPNEVGHDLNFESLEFYTTLPQEGDVIAYRLVELSSSWTPELSSYRVGKIARYDVKSNRVWVVQVPEYPIVSKEMENGESPFLSEQSPYLDDGSLWTEFSSLVEVRLVKLGNSNLAKPTTDGAYEPCIIDDDTRTDPKTNNTNGNGSHASSQENGTVNPWEEISQALSVKKEQLSQEDQWNNGEISSGRKPWSYRAMRGIAIGPTMALLRAQNEI